MTNKKSAMDRAYEMFTTPMNKLPPLAIKFLQYQVSKLMYCGEVALTSFAIYAQIVEGLECDNKLYKADEEDRKWFRERE